MASKRSHLAAPVVLRDSLDDMRSMADGKIYTSKRAYYESLRKQNLEIADRPSMKEGPNNPRTELSRPAHEIKRIIDG